LALTPGTRLGVYEVTAQIGVGGMGEVYRARDTKLGRDVALKILPDAFAADPDRLARFQREAHVLASLNHPHIAAIYGLEEGRAGTVPAFLVMELVEGEDLAQRIVCGALPLDEALPIARQICEALEAAHEQGIIHRDLKPANIKVRSDGTVKVLDFGLAKALDPYDRDGANVGRPFRGADAANSPTITTPVMMTGAGMILGTAAYMAPEQARGKAVDKRADIWAFGCVLYEMLTGTRAFAGDHVSEVLASVLAREPDWTLLPSNLSPAVGTYIRRCLHKNTKQRIADAQDIRLALEGAFDTEIPQTGAPVVVPVWRRVALASAAALLAGAGVATTLMWFATRPVPLRVSRLPIAFSPATTLTVSGSGRDLAITPDGSRVVYVGNNGTQLFVRALDALEPLAVFTGAPNSPFVSPDGHWIGFVDAVGVVLKKVAATGGPAVTLAAFAEPLRGATWGPDDTIIVATGNPATGLQRVAAAGGPATVLARPDRAAGELNYVWPELLPGGRAVLFTITALTGGLDAAQVVVLELQTGKRTVLVRGGTHAHYVPSGHLVYAAAGTLRAVAFDLTRLETHGTPVPVVSDVVTTRAGGVDAVVAGDGTLAYVSGSAAVLGAPRTLVWVDREGRETPIPAPPRAYVFPRLSPDATRIAVFAQDREADIWLWDLARTTLTQVTFGPGFDSFPVWTPDGRRLIFTSDRAGARNLFWQASDGTGAVEPLSESPNGRAPVDVSPDGRRLIFTETFPKTGDDVMQMTLDGTHRVTPVVQSSSGERNGVVSPDGRWLAYEANDLGRFEIYVRPFPDVDSGHWIVSTAGGTRPLWARSGQELFYVSPTGALMRVGVERGPAWGVTTPTVAVKEGYLMSPVFTQGRTYDIAPDGQRFLAIKEGGGANQAAAPRSLIVVLNWTEELKRLVPTR
jgi:hypothetical protein